MATGLIGTWPPGTEVLFPSAPVGPGDIFDQMPWEQPTEDNPWVEPDTEWEFPGDPGWEGGDPPGTDGDPGWQGGDPPISTWNPGSGGSGDGGTVTTETEDGGPWVIDITANRLLFYRIEVHDGDGDFITSVPGWISGKLLLTMDRASELEFTIPYDAEGAADLVRPNIVWLRNRWGFVVDTFVIQKRKPHGNGDASYITVFCTGCISQLGEEIVDEYDGTEAGLTVEDHVTALMDLQAKADWITVGQISSAIAETEVKFYAQDTTIHAALLALQLVLPQSERGRLYVDPQRRLQWRDAVGDQTEQIITRGRNVYAIDAEVDYGRMINRVYMYGEGQDPAYRLTLIDAGEDDEFLDNASSIATYGLRAYRKQDRRIRKPETLLLFAQRILEEFAVPPVTVDVELLDVAKADDAPAGWQDIYIGGLYRVQDSDLGLDTSIEIVSIETDLSHPVPIRVNLTNQVRDLADLFTILIEATQQPLDVDGERYPTMGRNYSAYDPREARKGDTRWNTADDRAEMYDGTEWREMGGGDDLHHTAATKGALPTASGVNVASVGRVDGVTAENGMFCVPNPDRDGWDALNFWE